MKNSRIPGIKSLLMTLCLMVVCTSANAAYVQLAPSPQANDGSIDLPPAGFTATYSPFSVVSSVWFADDVSMQSPANVASTITDQFGGTIMLADQNDSYSSGSISSANSFNVLTVHLGGMGGGNTLLFFFNTSITSFDVTTFDQGGGNNLSNYRAFNYTVPVPPAVLLLASALLGLAGLRRR